MRRITLGGEMVEIESDTKRGSIVKVNVSKISKRNKPARDEQRR